MIYAAAAIAGCVIGLALILVAWHGVPRGARQDLYQWDPVSDYRDDGVL